MDDNWPITKGLQRGQKGQAAQQSQRNRERIERWRKKTAKRWGWKDGHYWEGLI